MTPIVVAHGVEVVRDGTPILVGIDLTVPPGSLTAVVGPNGAGKSTLLAALMGYLTPTRGTVTIEGQPAATLAPRRRAAALAWLPQGGALSDGLTVVDVVAASRYRHAEGPAVARAAARRALDQVGLDHLGDRVATSLSGGEAQRIALAAMIAQESRGWLLDEPANHLDPAARQQVLALLLAAWDAGRALVVVLHDLDWLAAQIPVARCDDVQVVGLTGGSVGCRHRLGDHDLPASLTALYGVPIAGVVVGGRRRLLATP